MTGKRRKLEQIVRQVRQTEVGTVNGEGTPHGCREPGIADTLPIEPGSPRQNANDESPDGEPRDNSMNEAFSRSPESAQNIAWIVGSTQQHVAAASGARLQAGRGQQPLRSTKTDFAALGCHVDSHSASRKISVRPLRVEAGIWKR